MLFFFSFYCFTVKENKLVNIRWRQPEKVVHKYAVQDTKAQNEYINNKSSLIQKYCANEGLCETQLMEWNA